MNLTWWSVCLAYLKAWVQSPVLDKPGMSTFRRWRPEDQEFKINPSMVNLKGNLGYQKLSQKGKKI